MSDQQSGLVKIGALWRGKEGGKAIMQGSLGEARLLILPNRNKQNDRSPDYWVMVARKDAQGGQGTAQQQAPSQPSAYEDDDLPF